MTIDRTTAPPGSTDASTGQAVHPPGAPPADEGAEVAPGLRLAPSTPGRLRRFLGVLAVSFMLLAAGHLAAVIVVDPWDQFGQTVFEPLVPNQPRQKLDLYLALDEVPETVFMGASNVRQYQPSDAEAAGWGPSFNFAAGAMSLEEQLAIYRFLVDHDLQPDRMVFGVDLIGLRPGQINSLRLLTDPLIQPYAEGDFGWFDYLYWSTQHAINQVYIRDMFRAAYYTATAFPEPLNTYAPDGGFIYEPEREPPLVSTPEGRLVLERQAQNAVLSYGRLTEPARGAALQLAELVGLAAQHGQVVLFLPPYHPDYRGALQEHGHYDQWVASTLELFTRLCGDQGRVQVHDATDLTLYGGDPDLFSDGVHVQGALPSAIIDYLAHDAPDLCDHSDHGTAPAADATG